MDGGKLAREAAERLGVDKHLAPLLPDPPKAPRALPVIKAELDSLHQQLHSAQKEIEEIRKLVEEKKQ